jgi:hypothetical protein
MPATPGYIWIADQIITDTQSASINPTSVVLVEMNGAQLW